MVVWVVRPSGDEAKPREAVAGACCIAGWDNLPDFRSFPKEQDIRDAIKTLHPHKNNMGLSGWSRQILCFRDTIRPGDLVIMPVGGGNGDLHVGNVLGDYEYRPAVAGGKPRHLRPVRWSGILPKSQVTADAKGSIGAFLSVYRVYKPRFEAQLRTVVEAAPTPGGLSVLVTPRL
jgi:restriction system protein